MLKMTSKQEIIARTGFVTSVYAYAFFWGADLMQPGFVSRYFSVHIFLLCAIVFGWWWSRCVKWFTDRPILQHILAVVLGIILLVLSFSLEKTLGAWAVPLGVMGALSPFIFMRFIRSVK